MSLLRNLRLRFSPLRLKDPDFGDLLYMYIPNAPERSYWEASHWLFAPTGREVEIDLPGNESGPMAEARQFYLALPAQFPNVLEAARPGLERVFREWYGRPVSVDLWRDVKLAGFSLEDPRATPVQWQIFFEATGAKWLGIIIPFRDGIPDSEVVDT